MKTTRITFIACAVLGTVLSAHAGEAIPNRAPLKPTAFTPLDVGSIEARGWLADQLRRQADGLTGHAEELLPELDANSGWLGGKGEGWERGAYYIKGLVALAYVTKDPELIAKAKKWIDWTLENQRPDGQIGPKNNDDWWPRMVITWALRDYYEATKDPRVLTVLTKYAHFMQDNLPQRPLKEWGRARSGDQIDTLFWLYNRTGEPFLLETADLLIKQSNDWKAYYTTLRKPEGDFFNNHGVNVSQGLKYPLEVYQRSGDQADHDLYLKAWDLLNQRHGLIFGMWSGTEGLASKSTTQGVEMCTIAEQMLSNEIALSVVGEPVLGDQLERITYNLLPGGITKDFHQLQYYTLVNQPNARAGKNGVYGFGNDHGNDIVPGPKSGFPCCCFNLHMAWPKFVQHLWMASPDGGLAAVVYGPCEVNTTVGKTKVTLTEETDYPFADGIRITVKTDSAVAFPLRLRIPGWAVAPRVTVNGVAVAEVKPGTFLSLARTWKSGDVVSAEFPARLATTNGINGSAALWRGPLVFSLRIGEKATVNNNKPWKPGFEELLMEPTTPWNYALDLDRAHPEATAKVVRNPMPKNPWLPDTTPITLTVPAKRLPGWGLTRNDYLAAEVPASPATSSEPTETVTLVPFGAQTLRVTAFPLLRGPAVVEPGISASFRNSSDGTDEILENPTPAKSSDKTLRRFTFWDHKGTAEWVQLSFAQPTPVSSLSVFWFDDGGGCVVPASWTLSYLDGAEWKPVPNPSAFGTAKDQFNSVTFGAVTTTALRLNVQLAPNKSAGILKLEAKR